MGRTNSTRGVADSSVCACLTNKSYKTFAQFPHTDTHTHTSLTRSLQQLSLNNAALDSATCGIFPTSTFPKREYGKTGAGVHVRLFSCFNAAATELTGMTLIALHYKSFYAFNTSSNRNDLQIAQKDGKFLTSWKGYLSLSA